MIDNIYIFDIEVFAHDWLVVFKSEDTKDYTSIWNDNEAVLDFMEREPILGGFNCKHYDNHILKAILCGFSPEDVKRINDEIIVDGMNGWDIPEFKEYKCYFKSFDLLDDCQDGTSLKGFEAHLGIPIEETEVDFNIDRPLTDKEKKQTEYYCRYDVDATDILYKLRLGYLQNKINVGAKRGLDADRAMYMTNAKLTSVYLQAEPIVNPWKDERDYKIPDKLKREYIPQEVFNFFDQLHNKNIPNFELFGGYDEHGKKHTGAKLDFNIGDCEVTIAFGGIHGAIPNYVEESTDSRTIRNKDVASYYPHIMTIPLSAGQEYGFCSRAIPSPEIYVNTLETRVKAKKSGDKATANALKLVLNTTYGCMGNGLSDGFNARGQPTKGYAMNALYDPLMCRSVCITGQLFLLELTMHCVREIPSLKVIQLNTDGIMVSLDNADEPKWEEITQEWQDRTGFELEEDFIKKIVQRDVNNYVEVPTKGSPKVKGGDLVRGILTNANMDFTAMGFHAWDNISGGAFKINNDARVISKAIIDYFVKGTSPEETIANTNDILEYQIISKVGSKYKTCLQQIGATFWEVQKVNRVYATDNLSYGTLYKVHAITGSRAKVPSLPKHCIVDNNNELTIDAVNKDWYLKVAKEKIRKFLGIKAPRKNTRRINSLKKDCLSLFD